MRRLLMARHAKSSWTNHDLSDHDRPLNARGRRAAANMGLALSERALTPDLVYCSTSVRTSETWSSMAPGLATGIHIEYREGLYLASAGSILDAIASAPEDTRVLMVLGHNPGTHAVAAHLARTGARDKIAKLRRTFPTGAVAVIKLAIQGWPHAAQGGELLDFILPRELERLPPSPPA